MYQQNGIQSYRKTNVITADPGRLVILCYEGAIDNLILAKQKHNQAKYEEKAGHLKKTMDIIDELLCSLDYEKGGLIAKNLQSLYLYMTNRIVQAEVNRDANAIDDVTGMLRELLSAWKEAVARPDREIQVNAADYRENHNLHASGISI